jgi:3-hydroxyisobutyrate dehydrogenase
VADDEVRDKGNTIGFVGVGNMGRRMAANLAAAGFSLVVRDSDAAAQRRFVDAHGGRPADSPRAFAGATVVVTMLPDGRAVREAVLGWQGGIAAALAPGAVVLDMSSSDPVGTRALAEDLTAGGVKVVDAPVSGGIAGAESGTLSVMAGGHDEEAFALVRPVLETVGARIFRTGPLGSGHAMKALNNFLGASAYATAAEALVIGKKFGLDPRVMLEVVNSSSGRSFNTEVVMKEDVITGRYGTGFALGLLAKDVGIAADLAESVGVRAPALELVRRRWAEAAAALGFAADHSEAHKQWWPTDLLLTEQFQDRLAVLAQLRLADPADPGDLSQ